MSDTVTTVEGSSIRPTRYNGKTNFSAWKFKTLAYLQSLGLKEVVVSDPGVSFPAETETKTRLGAAAVAASGSDSESSSSGTSKKNVELKMQKCEKAYSILLNLLEDHLIDLVVNVEPGNAYRVWKVLLETFEAKSTASLCHRLDLLMNIQFDQDKESFDVFKARLTKLLLELKERGEVVSPVIQRYVLLRAMPPSYESLVQSLKINDNLSMEEVYTHIKDYYEANQRRHGSTKKEEESKFRSDVNTNGNSSLASLRMRKCFKCGSERHLVKHCPKQEEESSESSSDSDQSEADDGDHKKKKDVKKKKNVFTVN